MNTRDNSAMREALCSALACFPAAAYLVQNDADFSLLYGNHAFFDLFGCDEALMQYRYGNRLGALLSATSLEETRAAAAKQEPVLLTQEVRKPDGSALWLHTSLSFTADATCLCCFSLDITPHKKLAREFSQLQRSLQSICKRIHVETFLYYPNTHTSELLVPGPVLSFLSSSARSETGGFSEAVIRELIEPAYYGAFAALFSSLEQSGEGGICELRLQNPDTAQFEWFRLSVEPIPSAPDRALGVLEHIQEQKEAVLHYLTETQFFQSLLSEKTAYAQLDITDDRIYRMGGSWDIFHDITQTDPFSVSLSEFCSKRVHPDDRRRYFEIVQRDNLLTSFANGIARLGCQFRCLVDGKKTVWLELALHLFRDPLSGHLLALLALQDIDARKKRELFLLREAERDGLTDVFNRRMMERMTRKLLHELRAGETLQLVLLDIDDFRGFCKTHGHKEGDHALLRLTSALRRVFEPNHMVGRYGSDEFLVLAPGQSAVGIREQLRHVYALLENDSAPPFTFSIGLAEGYCGDTYEDILQRADTALSTAKKLGGGGLSGDDIQSSDKGWEAIPPAPSPSAFPQPTVPIDVFSAYLSAHGDIAYLVDPETYDLICGNQALYDRIGRTPAECCHMKCYEVMHKRQDPCPFCSRAYWSREKFYLWKNMNNALNQEFLIKNKLIWWEDQELLLALAVDISNNRSVLDAFDSNATESHYILTAVQHMAEAKDLLSMIDFALGAVGWFFRADSVELWVPEQENSGYTFQRAWTRKGLPAYDPSDDTAAVSSWLESRKWTHPIFAENQEAMLCYSYEMYRLMKARQLDNGRWFPLRDGQKTVGVLMLGNISTNFPNTSFLETFSRFFSNEWKKRTLMENVLYAASHDGLTQLLSRSSFEKFLHLYNPDDVLSVGVLIANFDNLKSVNSKRGVQTGDAYLRQFAEMLNSAFDSHSIFRLNGDEFLVIALGVSQEEMACMDDALNHAVQKNGRFSVSIGRSWDNIEKNLSDLIDHATQLMHVNKKLSRSIAQTSDDEHHYEMLHDLTASLDRGEFEVFLQPKVDLSTGKLCGAEALIRYRHPKLGLIPPARFIDLLERNNLIRYVDLHVFQTVCALLEKWVRRGVSTTAISLNFSRLTLLERDLVSSVQSMSAQYQFPYRLLEIEITESLAEMGKSVFYQIAGDLHQAGFPISLDDFGTKYSNLSLLSDLQFNVLKIDKSLVDKFIRSGRSQIILKSVINMCAGLDIAVIAEGIETPAQERALRELGCAYGQGYLYGKPMPIPDFEEKFLAGRLTPVL